MPLDELLATRDVVSLHLPLTDETRHLIDAAALALMKPGAVLVNTSRGPIVDEEALVEALRDGRIAGAALDVFEHEPQVHPGLLELENVVLVPHLGSATRRRARRWGCSASRRCGRCCSRTGFPRTSSSSAAGAGRARGAPARAARRRGSASPRPPDRPISCTPIGRPSSFHQSGSDTAGQPADVRSLREARHLAGAPERVPRVVADHRPDRHRRLRERRRKQQVVLRHVLDGRATERAQLHGREHVLDRVRLRAPLRSARGCSARTARSASRSAPASPATPS